MAPENPMPSTEQSANNALDYRKTLAEFASGVTVITGGTQDAPLGFACQSFSSVSLEPALVMFCVDRGSRTWPNLRPFGRFCVNVLGEHQQDVCWAFGSKAGSKFDALDWEWSAWETPALQGVLARIHADVSAVHEEGDHDIVIGRVVALERMTDGRRPLVFFRGTFNIDADATDARHTWTLMGGWI